MTELPTFETITLELGKKLVAAAGLACSPDNNQPWAFRLESDGIQVFHHRDRAVPSDVDGLFAGIAIGAALENLVLEASKEGLSAEIDLVESPFQGVDVLQPVAHVRFQSPRSRDPLADYLAERTTNRRHYRLKPMEDHAVEAITQAARERNGDVAWLRTGRELLRLAGLVTSADRIRFEDQKFHDEMHQMLRFSKVEVQTAGDGLNVASLEIPRFSWSLLRFLKPWSRMRIGNYFGLSRLFAAPSALQVVRSSAVGLLLIPRRDAVGYIDAGRAFQRLWIAAAAQGLAFHPLGALPLFLLRMELMGDTAFEPRHARRVQQTRRPFQQLFPQTADQLGVILFRVGYAKPPSARAARYPVQRILVD